MTADSSPVPPPDELETILLLSVDSLRRDRLHATRNGEPIMPNTSALAREALEVATGVSPGPATPDSVPAMLTGAYPSQFPGFSLPPAGSEPMTIAERLSHQGFATAGFHQNNLLARRYNFDRGFDRYHDISEQTRKESGRGTWRLRVRNLIEGTPLMRLAGWLQSQLMQWFGKSLYVLDEPGDSLTDRGIDWLEATPGHRFCWIHYMDSHHPYIAPPEIQELFGRTIARDRLLSLSKRARTDADSLTESDMADLEYAYDTAVRFVDEQIGRFFDHVDLENSLVVVTADHGEEFMERGSFGHRASLWDELVTVPLIVHHPAVDSRSIDGQAPLQLLPDTLVDGTGLLSLGETGVDYVIAETRDGADGVRCCRGNGFKLIVDGDSRTVTRIDADDEHIVDESGVPDGTLAELEAQLEETHEAYTEAADLDEESLREDLAALGYLDE